MVMVVIATCPVAPPKDIGEDKDLLVIDIATLPELYGILASLFKMARFRCLDINTISEEELRKHLGNSVLPIMGNGWLQGAARFSSTSGRGGVVIRVFKG